MSATEYLSEHGALASVLDGFSPRPQQQVMADHIDRIIHDGGILVTEAGTGVGKTFAYLVPAILSGKRVIIATGTKNLQDQLFHEDLPVVRKALGVPVTVALLKGRANYLCIERLGMNLSSGNTANHRHLHELEIIHDWAGRTLTGDISEVDDIEDGAIVWSLATSTTENCLGQECDNYSECFVAKARREAQAADLVVINHHLFFADMALKEQGFGDILPGADVFIIDEAHQLPEVAGNFFSQSITSRQIQNLISDVEKEHMSASGALSEVPDALAKLDKAVADLRLTMGRAGQRLSWGDVTANQKFTEYLVVVEKHLVNLEDWLAVASERSRGLENCYKRTLGLLQKITLLMSTTTEQESDSKDAEVPNNAESEVITDYVRWADTSRRGFGLHTTPLDVAEIFQANMQDMHASWIFTSATLAVGERFDHFSHRLGLKSPDTQCLGSPFDFKNNALLYLPNNLPDPSDPAYTREVCASAQPVIEAAQGRTFMLFTSYRALDIAAEFIVDHVSYPVLVQGSAPKQRLLKDFRAHGNAILLGTASFWEGVDVRGPALSCVIIDKLPFASPGDPVLQARLDAMRRRGMNPFPDYQLPHAVVTLKQGVGRLIRDVTDTGVLMLCDPRLKTKSYGRVFLKSLPDMPVTDHIDDVTAFFETRLSA